MIQYFFYGLGVIALLITIAWIHAQLIRIFSGSKSKRQSICYGLGMRLIARGDAEKHYHARRALYLAAAKDRCNSEDPNLPAWGE